MPAGRHRKTARVPLLRWVALTTPLLAVAAVVPVAVALEPTGRRDSAPTAADQPETPVVRGVARTVSRSLVREAPAPRMADVAALDLPSPSAPELSPRWVTVGLNVWSGAGEDSRLLSVLDAGGKVQVTGTVRGPWAQITRGDQVAWVHKAYLSRTKPAANGSDAPVSGAPCPDGSAVESGLTSHAIAVYRSVCAAFPTVTAWGGRTGSGDHGAGLALDIMCTGALGDAIAAYVRAHAGELGVSYVIWAQQIWTVERSGEGWRSMPDRGSSTANHYDHVHVTVY